MMDHVAKRELQIIGCSLFLLLGIAIYSITYARSAVRDDLRRQDITNIKRALEQYYNAHESYIAPPQNSEACTTSGSDSWFFGTHSPLLKEKFIDAMPHDVRESKGFTYSYCAKDSQGFYLEATMESDMPQGTFFDEDEQRKFGYRVVLEQDKLRYRVCGGEEQQCKLQSL